MYSITETLDGRWYCEGRVQDGTEQWYKPTRAEAVKSMKLFAKWGNWEEITVKQITFLRQVKVTRTTVETVPARGT